MYHAQHKSTGMNIALKCYLRDKIDPLTLSQIQREMEIHASVSHPAITNFYGSFEDHRGNIYLMLEYAKEGDVFGRGHIHSLHVLKPTTLTRCCFRAASRLQCLHRIHHVCTGYSMNKQSHHQCLHRIHHRVLIPHVLRASFLSRAKKRRTYEWIDTAFGLISKCGGIFSEAQTCRQVIRPVAAAVSYLHARNIIHRQGEGAGRPCIRDWL